MTFKVESNKNNLIPVVTGSPINQEAAPNVANAVDQIRARVMETIRTGMPITTLFNPALKIDLSHFIKDQQLFRRLAEFIAPLNPASLEMHFKNSEIVAEIKAMFRESEPYLNLLYEACFDVLNGTAPQGTLVHAMEGRIFTLKNALIAQHTPLAIQNSQHQNKIKKQPLEAIKEEGAAFIRATLALHLNALTTNNEIPFREGLQATAEQLIPFTLLITKRYLEDNGRSVPENPLTFRNPSGYNEHGLVAATVMEACLNALGYNTRMLYRSDLEPRVSLATAHALVEVTAPDNRIFLIDPCYVQFHKDILFSEEEAPKDPLLLLAEDEVEAYVDKKMMPHWMANFDQVNRNNEPFIQVLLATDKLISYALYTHEFPGLTKVKDPIKWVKGAFRRIWDASTYYPVFSNNAFQDIFYGFGAKKEVYNSVKAMNIASLTPYQSYETVETKLKELCQDPAQRGMNSQEALSLITQMPRIKRLAFEELLDTDASIMRSRSMDASLCAYFRTLCRSVNPEGLNLKVVYGCSGADCLSVFLATDAQEITMVDLTKISFGKFTSALHNLRTKDNSFMEEVLVSLQANDNFLTYRAKYAGSTSAHNEEKGHHMSDMPYKMIFNICGFGVSFGLIELKELPDGIQFDFPWKYHGAAEPRMRRIRLIRSDITNPATYSETLRKTVEAGFDIFYMKSSFNAPLSFPQFLPHLARAIPKGGWLMMSEYTFTMEAVDPKPSLVANGLDFIEHKSAGIKNIEEVLVLPINPLDTIPVIERNPEKSQRPYRTVGSDLRYWAQLTLRQKV